MKRRFYFDIFVIILLIMQHFSLIAQTTEAPCKYYLKKNNFAIAEFKTPKIISGILLNMKKFNQINRIFLYNNLGDKLLYSDSELNKGVEDEMIISFFPSSQRILRVEIEYRTDGLITLDKEDIQLVLYSLGNTPNARKGCDNLNVYARVSKEANMRLNDDSDVKKLILSPNNSTLFFILENKNRVGLKTEPHCVSAEICKKNGVRNLKPLTNLPIFTHLDHGICGVSYGNELYLYNLFQVNNKITQGFFMCSKTKNGKWKVLDEIQIEAYKNKNHHLDFFISRDGQVLFLAMENETSLGGLDLYMSFRKNNKTWSKPQNIGFNVNSSKSEYAPFLSSDNQFLYFSSLRNGKPQVYYSHRLDHSYLNWSSPKLLHLNENASGSYFINADEGPKAYYTALNKGASRINEYVLPKYARTKKQVLLSGKVHSAGSKNSLKSQLYLYNNKHPQKIQTFFTDKDGEFKINLDFNQRYTLLIGSKKHFESEVSLFYRKSHRNITVNKNFELLPIIEGQTIRLSNILFAKGKAKMLDSSQKDYNKLLKLLKINENITIRLSGHTDALGSPQKNLLLSWERVETIKNRLIKDGIPESKIELRAFGGTRPISKEAKQNRRVEFTILTL